MTHITPISNHSSMQAAYAEWTRITTLFKKTHQRAERVDLFLGASGDPRLQQEYSIRAHWTKEYEADARWLAANSSLSR